MGNALYVFADIYSCKRCAISENRIIIATRCCATYCIPIDRPKTCAAFERTNIDGSHAFRNNDAFEVRAIFERKPADGGKRGIVAEIYACKASATTERTPADGSHAIGNRDAFKACATRERPPADGSHAIGNRDTFKACATRERIIADGSHAIGNDDAYKTFATTERILADGGK